MNICKKDFKHKLLEIFMRKNSEKQIKQSLGGKSDDEKKRITLCEVERL